MFERAHVTQLHSTPPAVRRQERLHGARIRHAMRFIRGPWNVPRCLMKRATRRTTATRVLREAFVQPRHACTRLPTPPERTRPALHPADTQKQRSYGAGDR